MNVKTVITLCLICSFITACKSKLAMDYNNMIAAKQKSLNESMDSTEPNLKNYFGSHEYDSIASISSRMEIKIDSIVAAIKNKPAPKVVQAENFKKAALQYFDYMKSIYTAYKNYGTQSTPEGRETQKQIMAMVINQEDREIAQMQKAQQIFAKDNGFKIQSEKKSESGSLTASPPNR